MKYVKKLRSILIIYLLFISVLGAVIFTSDEAEAQGSYSLYDAYKKYFYVSLTIQGDYSGFSDSFNFDNGNGVFFGKCIEMKVTSEVEDTLQITVDLARTLKCRDISAQDMVITKEYTFTLEPYDTKTFTVYAMCMNMQKDAPMSGVYYNIENICTGETYQVVREISNSDSQDASGQSALWTVTDDAEKDYLIQYGATDDDIKNAHEILDTAGISWGEDKKDEGFPFIWIIVTIIIIVTVVIIVVLFLLLKRKKKASPTQPVQPIKQAPPAPQSQPFQPIPPSPPAQPTKPVQPEPPAQSPPAFCTNCGAPLKPDDMFCSECGQKVQ